MKPQAGLLGGPGAIPGVMPDEELEDAEADPGFIAARDWVANKLFVEGEAAEKLADAVAAQEDDAGVMAVIAKIAYSAIDEADAQANPPMKEENLIPLAMFVLEQLWDVAAAALKREAEDIDPAAIAGSFKVILIRFLREAGVDTSELEQAFSQLSPEDFRNTVREVSSAVEGSMAGGEPMAPEMSPEQPMGGRQ